MDFLKYIFEKSEGVMGLFLLVVKITAFFISLTPVLTYVLLYFPIIIEKYDVIIYSTLILGGSCLLFCITFILSQSFSQTLLKYKLKKRDSSYNEEKMTHYYFKVNFIITVLIHGVLSLFLVIDYYAILREQFIIRLGFSSIFIILFLFFSIGLWIFNLIKYIDQLEKEVKN